MTRHCYVLGTGLSHDGSACLLKDGRVIVAIEKERLTRLKHDGFNDTIAIRYCLDTAGISLADVSLIVQNANFGMFERGSNWFDGPRLIEKDMPVVTISHHLAHAYSAFGGSPFEEAAVLIIDGCGNSFDECMDRSGAIIPESPQSDIAHLYFEKDSYYSFGMSSWSTVLKDFSPWGLSVRRYPLSPPTTHHSIGGMYHAASNYVFQGLDDSGKLMGLAPYGRPDVHKFEVFDLRDGRAFVKYDWMAEFDQPVRRRQDLSAKFQYYADFALHMQKEVERALMYIVNSRYTQWPQRNLCYAGGVALNAVANTRILTEGPFEKVFIQPAAADNGLALGAAYYGWLEVLKRPKVQPSGQSRFGRMYALGAIENALASSAEIVVTQSNAITEEAADYLGSGKTVGWFQGASEFGPRALGGRSILADPRSSTVRNHINANIKQREDFRPFAPSVLLDDVDELFEWTGPSPYMLYVAKARPQWAHLIPSVVHADGTSRLQTVSARDDPLYYRLLWAVKNRTGLGMVLNTSLNRRGMPIVETPGHALQFFLSSALDVLVLGEFVVTKRGTPTQHNVTKGDVLDRLRRMLVAQVSEVDSVLDGTFTFSIDCVRSLTFVLRNGAGRVVECNNGASDVEVRCKETDLEALLQSPSNVSDMQRDGRLRVTGSDGVRRLVRLLGVAGSP